jgi:predicted MFS family arabinose efflux permease
MSVATSSPTESPVRALFRLPAYRDVFVGSLLWHTNRWGSLFAATLLLTQSGASPLRIQVIGALFFAPLLLGALAARAFAALATPRDVVLTMQLVVLPVQVLMVTAVALDAVHTWMTAAFMVIVGMGNTVNMTSQRLLIHETAGDGLAPAALTIEPVLSGIGSMTGSFGAGVLVDHLGRAASFAVLPLLGGVCVALTLRLPRVHEPLRGGPRTRVSDRRHGLVRTLAQQPGFALLLAVTVVMNLLVFGYTTLVPKVAESFSDSASLAGLLTAAVGLGQLVGGVVVAAVTVRRRGLLLVAGSASGIVGVLLFAAAPTAPLALLALFGAGLGQSGFSAMQSVMAVESPDPGVRSATLGSVSTAVGAMPMGMLLIGLVAQWQGARGGVVLTSTTGLLLLLAAAAVWRSSWRRTPAPSTPPPAGETT